MKKRLYDGFTLIENEVTKYIILSTLQTAIVLTTYLGTQ